jgi:hypothetical protein
MKIRHFLHNDMDAYWFEIVHSFNLLIPRPDSPAEINRLKTKKEPEKQLPNSSLLSKLHLKKDNKSDEELEGNVATMSPLIAQNLSQSNKKYPFLLLSDYGPPIYSHLNTTCWELLLLSRRAIEDIVRLLQLNVNLVMEPIHEEEVLAAKKELLSKKKDDRVVKEERRKEKKEREEQENVREEERKINDTSIQNVHLSSNLSDDLKPPTQSNSPPRPRQRKRGVPPLHSRG